MKTYTTFLASCLQSLPSVSFCSQSKTFWSQFQDLLMPAPKFAKSHLSHSWLFIPTFTPQCNYSLLTYLGGHATRVNLQSSVSWSTLKIAFSFWLLCLTQIKFQIWFPWSCGGKFKLQTCFTPRPTDCGTAASLSLQGLNSLSALKRAGRLTNLVSLLHMKR